MIAVSIDGVLGPPEQAQISIFDRGFLYGDGVFEVLRTWDGALTDLDRHLDRLYDAAASLELVAMKRSQLAEATLRTLAAAGPGEHRVRIVLTRGPGSLAASRHSLGPGKAIVIVEPLPTQPTEVSLAIVDWPLPRRMGPSRKTLAYLDHIIARELAIAADADEAVRLGPDGEVLECATANLFAVVRDTVVTPELAGVLPGVTRARVLSLCAEAGLPASEVRLTVTDLRTASEIFITSAIRGVVPVTRLDAQPREAGPLTTRIAAMYSAALRRTDAPRDRSI
jgi:branched-chain amino acid aminotransferase